MFRKRNTTTIAKPAVHIPAVVAQSVDDEHKADPHRMANGSIVGDRYRLEKTIGKGSYGKVKLAVDLHTCQQVAVKFIARSSIRKPAHKTRIRREINLLKALHHPNIVSLYETVETPTDIVLMMEYVPGADLFERLVAKHDQRFSEDEARCIFEQLVSAIEYCHQHRVIHRDLKPENVMVDDDGVVKLIDFGFANMYHPRGYLETNCGSPLYAAPEIVQGVRYVGPEVDVWSLGVVLFAMLTGKLPFEDEHLKGLYEKICAGSYVIPEYLSAGAQDLIRGALTVNPRHRITIGQAARHPWMHGFQKPIKSAHLQHKVITYPQDHIIHELSSYGFTDPDSTRLVVRTDPDDPATAIYHLLAQKEQRELSEKYSETGSYRPALSGIITPPNTPRKVAPSASIPDAKYHHFGAAQISNFSNPWGTIPSPDLAAPVIESSPMQIHLPITPLSLHVKDEKTSSENGALFSTPGSIVSQAAATVANHFKKLRGISIMARISHLNPEYQQKTSDIEPEVDGYAGYLNV